jgi:hypothetical protein
MSDKPRPPTDHRATSATVYQLDSKPDDLEDSESGIDRWSCFFDTKRLRSQCVLSDKKADPSIPSATVHRGESNDLEGSARGDDRWSCFFDTENYAQSMCC